MFESLLYYKNSTNIERMSKAVTSIVTQCSTVLKHNSHASLTIQTMELTLCMKQAGAKVQKLKVKASEF